MSQLEGKLAQDVHEGERPGHDVPGVVRRPPAPGGESVGPALTEFVQEYRQATRAMLELFRQSLLDVRFEIVTFVRQVQLDSNGDGVINLFTVPAGCTGYLMLCCVDEAGVTPAAPDTSADLWLGIYAGEPGSPTAAQADEIGGLLDATPSDPVVAAQIPYTFKYGSVEAAPTCRENEPFYLVVDAATASRVVAARGTVAVRRRDV